MHPWLGPLWVRAANWSIRESTDKGGFCTIAIDFLPGGEQPFTSEPDRVEVAFERIRQYADACVDDFELEKMSAGGLGDFIAAVQGKLEMLRAALSLASLPITWGNQVVQLAGSLKTELSALLALPGAYANAWRSLGNALGLGPDGRVNIVDTSRARVSRRIISSAAASGSALASTLDPAVRRNLIRDDALSQRLFVGAAARIALTAYRTAEDRDAALAQVVGAIDDALPAMADPVFQAAVSMRVAVIEALLAQNLAPAQTRDILTAMPAAVLAYRMGVDEDVLIARNRIRHPLFVQGRVDG